MSCRYRWYTTEEICMILDRFDGVVFIGDDMLRHIYAAFNILLRENVALGGLEQWKMTDIERDSCRCDHQFVKPECSNFLVSSSEEVTKHGSEGAHRSPFYCQRTPHFFLQIRGSPAPETLHTTLADLLAKDHDSYKPVPMIHSIGLSTALEWLSATKSMDEWLAIADKSLRNTPFLWVGPAAAGHLKPPAQIMGQGNNALWHYTIQTAKEAGSRGLEVLGMYNMTLQAASWDGSHYGEKVALVQAMTVSYQHLSVYPHYASRTLTILRQIINWLSRLESS
ncbi:hypothetical protein LTR04_001142 [Oleoguttula sp. CCFEE 6159]|nr:hypothetical protein LTR04_001142 [Oleoguttula sp. CCFEE 6159]